MIQVEHLTKKFGRIVAVDDISFKIEKGEIIGFLGPNGAGKSTTMNILTGCLSASEGKAMINGINILDEPSKVKKMIGYLPEQPPLYGEMTSKEFLRTVCDLKSIPGAERKNEIARVMEKVGITDVSGRLIRNLSKGYRQRVGLAQAMIGKPPIMILDEPTVGLDPGQIIGIRNLINDLGKDHTVILSSHILSEVQAVCERVMIIAKGKIIASDTPENLSQHLFGTNRLFVSTAANREAVEETVKSIPNIVEYQIEESEEPGAVNVKMKAAENADIRKAVFSAFAAANQPLLMMRPIDMSLEEIFLDLTRAEVEL
ncbi:MAG: ATP-binding cassette domain-containing protein [Bacteroidetes bacterium]|nr:ATP-binding cassette domain-containing protein [Bacteroidota bacterium]